MNPIVSKAVRGRPKTFDRETVLNTAMHNYWEFGATSISINEISRRAGVSKPSLYREFGNDDGLKFSALESYFETVVLEWLGLLHSPLPYEEVKTQIIALLTSSCADPSKPKGCLFADMRFRIDDFGPKTQAYVKRIQGKILAAFEHWIDRGKASQDIRSTRSSFVLAHFIQGQVEAAVRMQKDGVDPATIKEVLELSFDL